MPLPADWVELGIVLGGDGTIRAPSEQCATPASPSTAPTSAMPRLPRCSEGRRPLDHRLPPRRLDIGSAPPSTSQRGRGRWPTTFQHWALNEAPRQADRQKMIVVAIEIGSAAVSSFGADAPLSTSTGSAAYAFSAGGPRAEGPCYDAISLPPMSFARPLARGSLPQPTMASTLDGRRTDAGMRIEARSERYALRPPRPAPPSRTAAGREVPAAGGGRRGRSPRTR